MWYWISSLICPVQTRFVICCHCISESALYMGLIKGLRGGNAAKSQSLFGLIARVNIRAGQKNDNSTSQKLLFQNLSFFCFASEQDQNLWKDLAKWHLTSVKQVRFSFWVLSFILPGLVKSSYTFFFKFDKLQQIYLVATRQVFLNKNPPLADLLFLCCSSPISGAELCWGSHLQTHRLSFTSFQVLQSSLHAQSAEALGSKV